MVRFGYRERLGTAKTYPLEVLIAVALFLSLFQLLLSANIFCIFPLAISERTC